MSPLRPPGYGPNEPVFTNVDPVLRQAVDLIPAGDWLSHEDLVHGLNALRDFVDQFPGVASHHSFG